MSEHDEPKTALTRLLTRHRDRFHGMEADCSCGAWSTTAEESPGGHVEPFAAHLADVLLAEGYTTSPAPEATETVEWGVRFAPGLLGVRWDPTRGGTRTDGPYSEAEARQDSEKSGYPLVCRTRTGYEDRVTEWVPVDRAADEHEEGEQ